MSSVLPASLDRSAVLTGTSTAAAPSAQLGHRADIDGLRGIAVLSVLAVHAFPAVLRGGFIGVDIFFVLSGFLITGILLDSMAAARYSCLDFYKRRALRIFPALCLVLAACLAAAALLTFPADTRRIGQHVMSGAMFVSNVTLWREDGYFDVVSETKPLLHLWSLGIEEQFYLVWPLAIGLLYQRRRWALPLLCAGIVASFACNVLQVAAKPTATFFLPPSRFWELMCGALLAYLVRGHAGGPVAWLQGRLPASWWQRHMPDLWSVGGASLLALALWCIDKGDHFPGWWALLPVAGTFALLAAGPQAWLNRHVLAHPLLRFYGLISYPLYLWHWPLLSFPVVMGLPLGNEARVAILIASVVLAALTYELVEKPVRDGRLARPATAIGLCAVLAMIGMAGWAVKHSDGLLAAYPDDARRIAAEQLRFDYAEYRVDRCMTRLHQGPEIYTGVCADPAEGGQRLLFLWGDSHAASLYPGLRTEIGNTGYRLAQYTGARCPPLLATPASAGPHCAKSNGRILEQLAATPPDTVLIAAHWKLYGSQPALVDAHMSALRETVKHLQSLGVRRVVVMGHLPTWTQPLPNVLLSHWQRQRAIPERSHDHLDRAALEYDKLVKQTVAGTGAAYLSPVRHLCDAAGCQVSVLQQGERHALMNDESHLTAAGSQWLLRHARAEIFD